VTLLVVPSTVFLDEGWTLVLRAHVALASTLVMGFVGRDSSARSGFGYARLTRALLFGPQGASCSFFFIVVEDFPSLSVLGPGGRCGPRHHTVGGEKIQEGLSLRYTHLSRELRSRSVKSCWPRGYHRGEALDLERGRGVCSLSRLLDCLRVVFQRVLCSVCRLKSLGAYPWR
jgi:hypothetical protein